MSELWGRVWSLQVGTIRLEGRAPGDRSADPAGLNVEFKVKKSLRREPNTAEVSIWNLNRDHRNAIAPLGDDAPVILCAGYEETGAEMIFSGDLSASPGEWSGPNVVTRLEGSDGGRAYRSTRVQRTFRAGTPVGTVLRAAVEAMGIGLGNLPEVQSSLELTNSGSIYPGPTVLSGPARDQVDRIVRSCGATWSIQNGVFRIRTSGPARRSALELTPRSGLIGSPTRQKDRNVVLVHAEALLLPGAYPGRIVLLRSREIEGQYEISRAEYAGTTRGADWKVSLELREY